MDLNEFMQTEELHLKKLQELVASAIKEEQLISTKLVQSETEQDKNLTLAQRLADKIADFGGSWTFIFSFFVFMFLWILINIYNYFKLQFDPYPFILLNLILSCIAALQAPVIMMSQNRQEEKDRRRAKNDYLVNLKAEIEVRNLHSKIDLLITDQMKSLFAIQKTQLEILTNMERKIESLHKK